MAAQHHPISPFPTIVSTKALLMDVEMIRTLLIIDDERDMCLLLRRALHPYFGHIEFAHTLEEGAALALKISPDVILLDNNLPDGYGIDHIGMFRNEGKALKIIMVSAMDIRYEAFVAGADEFIGKPVDVAVLKSAIDPDKSPEN